MKAQKKRLPDWVMVVAVVGGIPAILAIGLLASGATVLWQTLMALLGIFLAVMALSIFTMPRASDRSAVAEQRLDSLKADPDSRPDLVPESLHWMPPPPFWPVTIAALKTTGDCPLGYKPGETWVIHGDGHISRPLCRPAVAALNHMFNSGSGEEPGQEAPCDCPFTDRQVVFAMAANSRE